MKELIKKILPKSLSELIGQSIGRVKKQTLFWQDHRRFRRNYSARPTSRQRSKLEARLIFHAHSIEKGLSHRHIRPNFGHAALSKLAVVMHAYNHHGFDPSHKAYRNALSVLREYHTLHAKLGKDVDYLQDWFGDILEQAVASQDTLGGVIDESAKNKKSNAQKNFKVLFEGRKSIREYSDKAVDKNAINEAIDIAMKTPSICNRQPSRIYAIEDPGVIKRALHIQGGMTGYQTPPLLFVITTDCTAFVDLTERNQPYVDGGLFSMALMMALEYKSIATCPLNAMFTSDQDSSLRKLLNIPDSELIIMLLAAGNFPTATKTPKSFRYDGQDITRYIK